jgi:valyl-tRNA synthetase
MREFPNKYNPSEVEPKWRTYWEKEKIYQSTVNLDKPKYSVVIPPPNVTGILHIGHILNNTIQDIYCRWKRMLGFEVCWVPGMDHAGIATQIMVERYLAEQGISKYSLGREKFVEEVWKWKEKHGGIILNQLKKLGVSVDWSKERFTLDEGLSKAVKEVFVDLYKKGYIYRGKRIINWDPVSQTALSDDEIEFREVNDKLYYIKYPLVDFSSHILIATTRPETMFGDVAVAVHPDDSRYKEFIGKKVILPANGKHIPVIADEYVDPEFGTGALKITPAHDLNDFEIGLRHNLPQINILDKEARLNELAFEFKGLDVFTARKEVVKKLKSEGYLLKEEEYIHNVSFGQKSGAVIEPILSDQWFVRMDKLAGPALKVVNEGKIKFHPDRYVKVYNHWMENIRDWCISRQLWWGHQIPIWYHKETGEIYCDVNPPEDIENWTQDPDVLDTWFSSWLWPFSVFGWENSERDRENKELNYYYPTDFLSTAADIIFLWVARMIMAGLEYMKDIPFKDVYFHSIVRDGKGRKMSKTLGNSPDPLDIMDKYGTDALRFTIIYLAPLGNDILFDEDKTEIGRNFITKLWNAGRFLHITKERLINSDEYGDNEPEYDFIDAWIDSRFAHTLQVVKKNLDEYKLNEYAKSLYSFVWNDFCDWYIELLKIKIEANKLSARAIINTSIEIYKNVLKLLHPVIPFVTEELWHIFTSSGEMKTISFEKFPELSEDKINLEAEENFEKFIEIIVAIRNLRAENKIPFSRKCKVTIKASAEDKILSDSRYYNLVVKLCNLEVLNVYDESFQVKDRAVSNVLPDYEIFLLLDYDSKGEGFNREKFLKEKTNLEKYLQNLEQKLKNEKFLSKASPAVVEKEREKYKEALAKLEKLNKLL